MTTCKNISVLFKNIYKQQYIIIFIHTSVLTRRFLASTVKEFNEKPNKKKVLLFDAKSTANNFILSETTKDVILQEIKTDVDKSTEPFNDLIKKLQTSCGSTNKYRKQDKGVHNSNFIVHKIDSESQVFVKPKIEYINCNPSLNNKFVKTECLEQEINKLIKENKFEEALARLVQLHSVYENWHPQRKLFHVLAVNLASDCKLEQLKELCKIFTKLYHSGEFKDCLVHYEAEALWKSGKIEEAIHLFEELYKRYQNEDIAKKKLKDMTSFLMLHVVSCKLHQYSDTVNNFVDNRINDHDFSPACNWWKHCFCSGHYLYQQIAENLLSQNPKLIILIPRKFPQIIEDALINNNHDVLLDLVQLALRHQMKNCLMPVFSAYLEYFCNKEDTHGAEKVLKFCMIHNIVLTSFSMRKLLFLLNFKKRKVPDILLKRQHDIQNMRKPNTLPYKF